MYDVFLKSKSPETDGEGLPGLGVGGFVAAGWQAPSQCHGTVPKLGGEDGGCTSL